MSLANAEAIRTNASRLLAEKELEAFMESTDFLEQEAKRAYWNLRAKVGQHRANEIMAPNMESPF